MDDLAPPTGEPAVPVPVTNRSRWVMLGVLGSVVAVLASVLGLGGFETRRDAAADVEPGAEVDAGNLVYSFSAGTVQKVASYGTTTWEARVRGTVRNEQDTTLAPLHGDYGSFLAYIPQQRLTGDVDSWLIGTAEKRDLVPPGTAALPLEVSFELPESYSPTDTLTVLVFPMEYTENIVLGLGGGSKSWNIDSFGTVGYVEVPVTRLPDEVIG